MDGQTNMIDYINPTQKFCLPPKPATLNVGQGNRNWHQTVQFSAVYHHTKFEINRVLNA